MRAAHPSRSSCWRHHSVNLRRKALPVQYMALLQERQSEVLRPFSKKPMSSASAVRGSNRCITRCRNAYHGGANQMHVVTYIARWMRRRGGPLPCCPLPCPRTPRARQRSPTCAPHTGPTLREAHTRARKHTYLAHTLHTATLINLQGASHLLVAPSSSGGALNASTASCILGITPLRSTQAAAGNCRNTLRRGGECNVRHGIRPG
jgi:hypothetical protein